MACASRPAAGTEGTGLLSHPAQLGMAGRPSQLFHLAVPAEGHVLRVPASSPADQACPSRASRVTEPSPRSHPLIAPLPRRPGGAGPAADPASPETHSVRSEEDIVTGDSTPLVQHRDGSAGPPTAVPIPAQSRGSDDLSAGVGPGAAGYGASPADQAVPAEDGAGVSTGALARRLGVSPTTIRSWERRYGIGPAQRAPGRHRRWEPQDVLLLEEMCRLTSRGVPPAEAARTALAGIRPHQAPGARDAIRASEAPGAGGRTLPVGTVRAECRGMARAAVRPDAHELTSILRESIRDLGLVVAWTEVISPALRAAGRQWATEGERFVEVEHLLSWHVAAALRETAHRAVPAAGPTALLACTPNELHSLALEAVAAGLAERGLSYLMFGPALPPQALLQAVHRTGPSAVLLWSQVQRTADRALADRIVRTSWGTPGARVHPTVITAGPGWTGTRVPGALRPRDLGTALDQLTEQLL